MKKINIMTDLFSQLLKDEAKETEQQTAGNSKPEPSKKYILSYLYQLCYDAHRYTSYSPEKRANSYIKEYSELLEEDLKKLGYNAGNYKEKYISKFSEWMGAKSRCISSMITGPANFPTRRAEKANDSERKKGEDFYNWREKYFIAVNRVPTKSPEEEIIIAERKHEILLNFQIELKAINAEIRKFKSTDQKEIINHLIKLEYKPDFISLIDLIGGKCKIPSYVLTNNNATIKNTANKIKIMKTRINRKNTWKDIIFEGGRVTIEDDRLKIYHDEKPPRETITEIKKNGYKWSPHWGCWCRKHTGNAVYCLRFLSFIPKN